MIMYEQSFSIFDTGLYFILVSSKYNKGIFLKNTICSKPRESKQL